MAALLCQSAHRRPRNTAPDLQLDGTYLTTLDWSLQQPPTHNRQISSKQHHIYPGRTLHDVRYLKLLYQHSHGPPQIHMSAHLYNNTLNHTKIQPKWNGNIGWMGVHLYKKGGVCTKTIRTHIQWTNHQKIGQIWLCSHPTHPGPLETQ